jgi:O-antigen ligase
MKNYFIIQDTLENKISYYHLVLFLIMLPFDRFYSELILISLLLHTIIHINKKRLRPVFRWQTLVLGLVFFLNIAGMIWSQDKEQALKDMQRQLAILLFPLILSATALDLNLYRKRLFTVFGFTCVLTILYLYADAIRIILYNHLPISSLFSRFFINHNFSAPIGMHATYLGMYVALSMAFFIYALLEENNNNRILYTIAVGILLGGLMQLASRSVLLAVMLICIFVFPFFMLTGIKRVKFILVSLIVSMIIVFGITKIDSFKKRYLVDLKDDLTQVSFNNEISEPRALRWHYAFQLVSEAPLIGFGSGSEKRLLKEKYFENKLYTSFLLELNAHNQYLSFFIKNGVFGLIIFLFTVIAGYVAAWHKKDIVFACFLILISVVSFSENILDVNKGIFFYAFFFSFFVLAGKPFYKLPRLVNKKNL